MIVWFEQCKDKRQAIKKALPPDLHTQKHGKSKKYWYCGAGFDCETTKTPKGYSYVYLWQFSLHDTDFHGRTASSFEEFTELLDDVLQVEYRKRCHGKIKSYPQLLIYDANFGYEYAHFEGVFRRLGVVAPFAKDIRHPLTLNVMRTLEFREALGVWGYSLENIGELWTKTKKAVTYAEDGTRISDLDYSLQRHSDTPITEGEQVYTGNDVRILSELGIIALDMYKGKKIPITGTGIIRQATKDRIYDNGYQSMNFEKEKVQRIIPHNLDDYHTIMNFLYCGGLTHSNVRLARRVHDNVICADLVSDFPGQMTHEQFPAGSMIGNRSYEEMLQHKHWYALVTFYNLRSKTGHSIISQHKCIELYHPTIDNGRIYAAEVISVYLTEIDFQNVGLIYTCSNVEFSDIHIFTQSKPCPMHLLSVMWEKYAEKTKLKAPKAEAKKKLKEARKHGTPETLEAAEREFQAISKEYEQSKKFVNGCYGMTSTRIYETEIKYGKPEGAEHEKLYEDVRTDKEDGHKLTYNEMTKDMWLSPWIAIYTTAYARRILCRLINKYPDIILQYDTDSIYFLDGRPGSSELRAEMENYNDKIRAKNHEMFAGNPLFEDLGTWEFDPPIDQMKVLGAKRYLKRTGDEYKLVCAGCKPDAFAKYCKDNKIDPFDFFDTHMRLPPDDSKKTTLRYYPPKDKPYEDDITDYNGVTRHVQIECCASIIEIPFNLYVSSAWIDFMKEKQRRL